MNDLFEKINDLSKKRINYLHNINNRGFYKWAQTYFDWVLDEIQEVKDEYRENNSVYLEDELWDVFWDYMCLLHSLEQEKKIDMEKVFERCYKKFSERIWVNWDWNWNNWQEVKQAQKQELLQEHNLKYKK